MIFGMIFKRLSKHFFLVMVLSTVVCLCAVDQTSGDQEKQKKTNTKTEKIQISVDARETKKVPVVLFLLQDKPHAANSEDAMHDIMEVIAHDLSWTEQFETQIVYVDTLPTKKELQKKYGKLAIAVSITHHKNKNIFNVRMYDIAKGSVITRKEYKVYKKSMVRRGWGHAIADLIFEVLTNKNCFFSSKLTYCKQLPDGLRCVCVSDFDGSHATVIAKAQLLIAPRWNNDDEDPSVLYSKYTSSNIRLMKVDLATGKQESAVSFCGLNMLPAFAPDGSELVLCLSCKGSNQLYSYAYDNYLKKMKYTQLTFNDGNNISPTLLDNNDVVFCSDFEDNRPTLYRLIRSTHEVRKVLKTTESCFSPAYSSANKKLVYSKIVAGAGQLFTYSFETEKETQLTFDGPHKQEVCWSPCGNYVLFEIQEGENKRIAVQNISTGQRKYVTPAGAICMYPAWSANFALFPAVKNKA